MLRCGDESMLQHLCIAREEVAVIKGAKEIGAEKYILGVIEDAYLIFQRAEIDARFASYAGIDHGKKRRRDVDEVDAALEGAGSKAAQVSHHTTPKVDEQRMACSTAALQFLPHMSGGVKGLIDV